MTALDQVRDDLIRSLRVAQGDLDDAQMRLRVAASCVARLQTEVKAHSLIVQQLDAELDVLATDEAA